MLRLRLFTLLVLLSMLVAACVPASPTSQPGTPPANPTAAPQASAPTLPAASPTAPANPSPTAAAPTGPTPNGAWIAVSPQTASPGGSVQIQGFLPGGPDQAAAQADRALQHANLCWQDCLNGLVIQG